MPDAIKRGITLRAMLVALVCGAALYVAVIAAVIVFRIGPTASSLGRHSEALQAEFEAVRDRAATLKGAFAEAREFLRAGERQVNDQKLAAARSLLTKVQTQVDDSRSIETARALAGLPSEMRIALWRAADAESQLGVALIEVLSRIELGDYKEAAARLTYCDSLNDLTAMRLAEAQAAGLTDVIERQRALGAAADLSVKSVAWWAAIGLLLVPLLARFVQRRFYARLAALDRGLAQVSEGELDTAVEVGHADELGRLSRHFNEMTAVLRHRADEERRRQDEELRKQQAFLDELFEGSPEAIVLLDTNDCVLRANHEFTRMFGYTLEEVLDHPFNDRVVPPEQREEGMSFMDRALGGEKVNVERVRMRKDGSRFDASVMVFPITTSQGHIAFYSIYRDITERKQVEAALHALSDHLQQVREDERTHIAREIHDELGQGLTALRVDLAWVADKLSKSDGGDHRDRKVAERVDAMSSLSDSIIETVQKIATELRPGILDNLGLTAAIEWQTGEFSSRTGIHCDLDGLEEIDGLDQAPSTACFRILQETLTNISRHANATEVKVSLKQQDERLILRIHDNGKGISDEEITDQVIDRSARDERTGACSWREGRYQGPRRRRHNRDREHSDNACARKECDVMRVLLADDHTVFREGLKRILSEAADISEIGEASNAQQLLERISEKHWDVVLLDINMPGKSGLEVLKEIKQSNPRIAVLMLSMYPESQFAVRVIRGRRCRLSHQKLGG